MKKLINKIILIFLVTINLIFSGSNTKENKKYHLFHSTGQDFRSIYQIMMNGFIKSNHKYANYHTTDYTCFWNITEKISINETIENEYNKIIEEEKNYSILNNAFWNNFRSSTYTIYNGGFYINSSIIDNNLIENNEGLIPEEIRIKQDIPPEKIKFFFWIRKFYGK